MVIEGMTMSDEELPCPNCQGTGKVIININHKDCDWCHGRGLLRTVPPLIIGNSVGGNENSTTEKGENDVRQA